MRLILLLLLIVALPALALDTMPVADIKPGMKGHGLSVFSGTKIERFDVTIVSVMQNSFPGQDMILARLARHGKGFDVNKTGLIAGMSGSPIYIGEKLIGALAYGWSFNREPLCGITPIANMIAEQKRPPARRLGMAPRGPMRWPWKPGAKPAGMRPLRAPLIVSGATRRTMARLRRELDGSFMVPLEGGSGGRGKAKDARKLIAPGAAMSVMLMEGDFEFSAVGTVTYVDGDTVVGFGHPFFGSGDCALPMAAARIDGIVNSSMQAFKLGSPLGRVGRLTNDRQAGVVGALGKKVRMVPITATLRNRGAKTTRTFQCRAVEHPRFTPLLLDIALSNFVDVSEPNDRPHAVHYTIEVAIAGREQPLRYSDIIAGAGMVRSGAWTGVFGMIWSNRWAAQRITSVTLEADIVPGDATATITGARMHKRTVTAGDVARVTVELARKDNKPLTAELALRLPADLPAGKHEIRVVGGDLFGPAVPQPRSLAQLEAQIAKIRRGDDLIAYITLPRLSLQHGGKLLTKLPRTMVGALLPPGAHGEVGAAAEVEHTAVRMPWSIRGRQRIVIVVEERK